MTAVEKSKFHSPFIWNTFSPTTIEPRQCVYQRRLIELYQKQYPILNDFTRKQINEILELRKLKKCEEKLGKEENKLIYALELLQNEYYGNEHVFYAYLCQKYDIECKAVYDYHVNTVTDKLMENEQQITCAECMEIKSFSEFNHSELLNGYFAACKECEPDRDSVQTLKWSKVYKSDDVVLKHNDFLATVNRNGHRYACIETNHPIKSGVACWRWCFKQHKSWLLFGVSNAKKMRDGSYNEPSVYGIASSGSSYKNGASAGGLNAGHMYNKAELLIDCKLDLNKNEMCYMVVGDAQKRIVKMVGVPKSDKGYVPHMNIYYENVNVQVKKIPAAWFGKNPKRCKFKY